MKVVILAGGFGIRCRWIEKQIRVQYLNMLIFYNKQE